MNTRTQIDLKALAALHDSYLARETMGAYNLLDTPCKAKVGDEPSMSAPVVRGHKLTEQIVSSIKCWLNRNEKGQAIAQQFNISLATISAINTGQLHPQVKPFTKKQIRKGNV